MSTRRITVADLYDQTGKPGPHPCLYCEVCESTFSANKGDYWNTAYSHVFQCCERNMRLVMFRRIVEDWPV